jgi:hypothetical protein
LVIMAENLSLTYFLIGLALGSGVAFAGGIIEYVLHLRRRGQPRAGAPSCLLYAAGGLILTGIAAVGASLLATGGIKPALIMGAGVLTGFYGGFILLVGLWFLIDALHPTVDESARSDTIVS